MTRSHSVQQLWLLGALSVGMMAIALIWAMFDTRTVLETEVWVKPLKFAVSFAVFFATLAWAAQRLSAPVQEGILLRVVVTVLAVSFWFEMIYITYQAALGQTSHFNLGDPFHGAMYALMGVAALRLVLGTAAIGVMVLRDAGAVMSVPLRLGVGIGFCASTVLTLVTAFTLSSMAGHFVGTPAPGAAVLPMFGWSGSVGDLRPSHFLALHMMQAIPLLAMLVAGRSDRAVFWVVAGSGIYAALTLAVYVQALMGLPLLRL
jgi:hypothetical protein